MGHTGMSQFHTGLSRFLTAVAIENYDVSTNSLEFSSLRLDWAGPDRLVWSEPDRPVWSGPDRLVWTMMISARDASASENHFVNKG